MALTFGIGPLARPSRGRLNSDIFAAGPAHAVFTHPVEKRLWAEVDGRKVVDTTAALMLHETGLLPVYYVPVADVAADVLVPSDTVTSCPFKGKASYHHLRVGDRMEYDAVWSYPEPFDEVAEIADYCSIRFDAVDTWWEECQPIEGHPRDPFHRVDCLPSSRRVVIRVGPVEVADSSRAIALFETGLPARFYVPPDDIAIPMLPSETHTTCPYKGRASYVHALGVEDIAWVYPVPLDESAAIEGRYCFDPDKTTMELTSLI